MQLKIVHRNWKDVENTLPLAEMLAQYFPDPKTFTPGICELLLNAVEHGNLGIGLDAKTQLIRSGRWQAEINKRLALPEHAFKYVEIGLTHDRHECRLTITDQGNGFTWRDHVNPIPSQRPNGRGLSIVFHTGFDRVEFNPIGNSVTCAARFTNLQAIKI